MKRYWNIPLIFLLLVLLCVQAPAVAAETGEVGEPAR